MNILINTKTIILITLIFTLLNTATAKMAYPAHLRELDTISADKQLSKSDKIFKLKKYLNHELYFIPALRHIINLDSKIGEKLCKDYYRKEETALKKYQLAQLLLRSNTIKLNKDFLLSHKKFLIDLILKNGEKEFCRVREHSEVTAVGEYVKIAQFNPEYFQVMSDQQVVAILKKCLKSPNTVHPKIQHGCIRFPVGTDTGRNWERNLIPKALKLIQDKEN